MQAYLPSLSPAPQHKLCFDEPLPQAVLDIDDKTRTNAFAWRGQFSPQLVESLLLAYCPEGSHVLDPFSGSGTSLLEAARLRLSASAFEINPAAWRLTRVYTLCTLSPAHREAALIAVSEQLAKLWASGPNQIERRMRGLVETEGPVGIVTGALVILMDLCENGLSRENCEKTFQKVARSIRMLPLSDRPVAAFLGDARSLPLSQATVDFVLTSPPYINVFNYHQHYRRSAEMLGHDLLLTARSEIGSNRANRGNRFLTVAQYCLDMAATLKELRRVCKADSRLILVVGHESNVLGVPFFNAELVMQIAESTKSFRLALRQERWYTNKFGKRIREDLLHFAPNEERGDGWECVAREAADSALKAALSAVADKNRAALEDAINRVPGTFGTPLLKTQ